MRYPELGRKVTEKEYDALVDYAIDLGVECAYIQEGDTAEESRPSITLEGVYIMKKEDITVKTVMSSLLLIIIVFTECPKTAVIRRTAGSGVTYFYQRCTVLYG